MKSESEIKIIISENSLLIYEGVLRWLKNPRYIGIMFSPDGGMMRIAATTRDIPMAVDVGNMLARNLDNSTENWYILRYDRDSWGSMQMGIGFPKFSQKGKMYEVQGKPFDKESVYFNISDAVEHNVYDFV